MAIEVSEGWGKLLKTLTGMPFPQANEDTLRVVSDEYRQMAEKFREVEELLRQVVGRVDEDFEGETATRFVAYARQFVERTNGNESILERAYEDALKLSKNAHKTAADIEYTKWMIFGQLALLVVQIALAQALMPVTAGLSEIWAAAAIAAFRAMAMLILKFLLTQIIMQTITGLVGGLLLDSILQLTQMGRGDRTEWNKNFTADAAKFAAIGGALGGPFALLGGGLGKLLGNLTGKGLGKILGNDAGKVLGKGLAGGGKGAGGAAGGAGKAAGGLGKSAGGAGAGGLGKGAGGAGAGGLGKGAGGAGAGGLGKGAGGAGAGLGKGAGGVGAGLGKGAGAAGDGAAGATGRAGAGAAGQAISEESARKLGERLGNIMGRTNESLNHVGADGARGAAAGAVGREVVKDFANAFEKNLGDSLGNETARNLGRDYGEALVKNWGGKADWQGLTHSLDDALKPYVKDLGESGVRALSHDLPGSFVQTISKNIEGNIGFRIGNFVGEIAGESGHAVVTEGMYNLIFGPEHKFTVSGWTAAAGAAGGVMGRGIGHGFQTLHHAVQGPPAAPPPRPPVFSSDSPTPPSTAPRPTTESNPGVRDGSGPKNDSDNRTLTDSSSESGSDSASLRSTDDNGSDGDSLYYLDTDDFSDSRTLFSGDDETNAGAYEGPGPSAPAFATSSNDTSFTNSTDNTSTTDRSTAHPFTPEPPVPPAVAPELDLLLNSLPDVPETSPSPDQASETVTHGSTDVDRLLEDLPDVPETPPGEKLTPELEQLLADLPDVPRNDPPVTSDDGEGGVSTDRSDNSGQGKRTADDLDRLQERLDRLKDRQNPGDSDSDLAARLAKLRADDSGGLGRPARVDELREQYRAALEEDGTDGTTTGEGDGALPHGGALPYNGAGGSTPPPRPLPTVSTAQGAGSAPGGPRHPAPAGPSPDGSDLTFPDIPQNEPGGRLFTADEPDLVFPDVPEGPPGTERTESESEGHGPATEDSSNPLRTETQDDLPFPEGFDPHDGGGVDALITRLDELGGTGDGPVNRLDQLPDVPDGPTPTEQRRLTRDVDREADALLADARRVGVDRETRQRLGESIRADVRAGRHADAADGLRELGDLVAVHGLGERLRQFRGHVDGGYELRAAQLGMRRTEWLRHALDIEQSALGSDPRRTTQLLDEFENRLGALGSELGTRADSSPEALREQLADNRRADAEEAGMDRERFLAWEDRREQAATPEDLDRIQADYDAELTASRRLATLRDLGASERELADWKSRFEGQARSGDLDAQYERRTATLGREAELASFRARLDALREGGHQQDSEQPPPPPQDGPDGDGTPDRDRSEDAAAENDRLLEERLDRLREGMDGTGLSREERQQWEDRRANAEDDGARRTVEQEQFDRMAQLERDRRLKALSDADPAGAERSPERRAEWQKRLDEAAGDHRSTDRILDSYDAETAELRREGQERLEQELRAPDRLRDLDGRIDRSLDKLPDEIRRQAAHDARSLVERLRNLATADRTADRTTDRTSGGPKTDDSVSEKSKDVRDTDLTDGEGSSKAGPSTTVRTPAARTNVEGESDSSAKTPRPTGSEQDRRAPVQPGEQLMETPRQRDDSSESGGKDGDSLHTRDRDDLPSPNGRRIRTQSEDDTRSLTEDDTRSLTDTRTNSESEPDNDHALKADDTSDSKDEPKNESEFRDESEPKNESESESKADDADSVASVPEDSEIPVKGEENEEPPGGPGGGPSRADASSLRQRPTARDKALDALAADEYEQRMYRARRDRPDLTSEEALRDEVYRRIGNPGEKVVKAAFAAPLLESDVAPLTREQTDGFVTYDDNAMLPKSLRGQGHGRITVRGVDALADSLATGWRLRPDGLEELRRVLSQSPHTLLSPRTFVLPTVDGGLREISLSLESYGNWRRHAEPSSLAPVEGSSTAKDEAAGTKAAGEEANKTAENRTTKDRTTEDEAAKDELTEAAKDEADGSKTDGSTSDRTKTGAKTTDAPVKIETELRTRPGATETKSLGTSRAFGVAIPLGPSAGNVGGLGSLSLGGRRMEAGYTYTQESRAQSSVTAVGKDGSHLHVSDLHIAVESSRVWDSKGREAATEQQQPGTVTRRGYRIQDGVTWRVPDSVTDPAIPDRLPTAFTFAPGARPHLLAPLNVTTETRLLDWALVNFPEATPGSFLRRQLADLFGEESLRTMIAQSSGETVVSAPLFAGLGNRSLGSVELRLVPVDATLLQASDKTEVKKADAQRSTATTEKKNTQGASIGISAGPQVALLQPVGTLSLQVAGSAALTTQRAESSYSGNTAESVRTLNSRGHSGLYDVRFRIELRRQGGVWESPEPAGRTTGAERNAGNAEGAFLTATVQLPRADARRLAGWDDGTSPLPAAEAPPAPAYLSPSNPATFGLHAVLDLTASHAQETAPSRVSLTDVLVDRIQAGLHRAYPDLVLPSRPDTDATGGRSGGSDRKYNNAVRNTHLLRQALSRTVLEGSLDRLTSTGLRIQLEQLDSVNKRYVVLTVRAEATNRQFAGTHHDLGLANNVLSTRRADSATTRTHGWSAGVDIGLTGIKGFGGTGSIGYRYGRQSAYGMTYGPTLTPDGGITSSGSQHLWSYDLAFTARATSFTRPRQIARTMTGELLSTRWFVKQAAGSVDVLGTGQGGGRTAPAPVTGRVTLAVPASLSVVPDQPVIRPERVLAPEPVPMDPALADLLSSGKPVSTDHWTPHALFDGLHSVQSVNSPEVVLHHLKELLAAVSGNSWIYGTDGTPASGALTEAFTSGRNEADFSDAAQTGKHISDLFGRTAVTDITASVSAWPQVRGTRVLAVVDSSDLALSNVGSGTGGAGHSVAHVRSHTISGLLAFRAKHTDALQTAGTYGLTASPYQRTSTATTAETFSANPAHTVQYTGPMVLVGANVAWHLAARSQPSGLLRAPMEAMRGRPPQGRIVEIPDGLLVWMPLAEARKAGLFDDGLTAPPPQQLYTAVEAAPHATLTVGRIDMSRAIHEFTNRMLETLPQHKSWLGPKSLLADQLGGLARQMTTLSPSGIRALQSGMENGGTSLRLARNKIGPAKDASFTVTLTREGFTPGALRHDVKPTIARPTSTGETVTEKLARGYEAGYRLGEVPTVLDRPGLRSGGFTLDDRVGSTRSSSLAHAVTDAVSAQVAFEGPVVTGRTRFSVTFTLELPDGTVVRHTYPVGDAEVVLPLSLARPQSTEQRTAEQQQTEQQQTEQRRTEPKQPLSQAVGTPPEPARPMLLPPDQQQAVPLRQRNEAGRKLFATGPESVVVTTVGGITVLRDAAAYAVDLAVKGRGTTTDAATVMPTDGNGRYVRRTVLTRPGTAAGEVLKGGISTDVLSAYLPQMVRDGLTVTLHDTTSTIGGTDATLKISADVDLSRARLLAVDPGAGLGGSRRTMDNDTYTGDITESHAPAMTAGPAFETQPLVQSTAAVPGWTDSDASGGAADRRTSALTTLKPFAGGAVLIQAPLHVLQTAKASHRIADLPVVPPALRPGSRPPVSVEHTVQDGVTMWVSFDVAREHGLLPPEVEAAADTVKEQTKKYTEAATEAEGTERRLRALGSEVSALHTELRRLLETPAPPGPDVTTARQRLATARSRYAEAQQDLANQRRVLATAERHLAGASEAAWKAVDHYTVTGARPTGTPPVPWSEPPAVAAVETPVAAVGYPPLTEVLAALESLGGQASQEGPASLDGPATTGLTRLPGLVPREDVLARTGVWLDDAGPLSDTDAVRREQIKAAGWAQRLRAADAAYRSSLEAVRAAPQADRDTVAMHERRAGKSRTEEEARKHLDAARDAGSAYDRAVTRLTADFRELAVVQANFDAVDASTRGVRGPRTEGSATGTRGVTPWHPAPEPEGYVRPSAVKSAPEPYVAQGEDTQGRPTGLKAPDGRVLQLVEPPSTGPAHLDTGTSFHRSLLDAVGRAHPRLLADLGLHGPGRNLSAEDVGHLRQRLADRLMEDGEELAEFLAIDPQERFTAQELADAAIVLGAAEAAEHADSRGRLPDTVAARLTPVQRLELARTTLLRPGAGQIGDRKDTGWNHSAGDLAALLAARVLGVPVTVVQPDLSHLTFAAPVTDAAGNTRSGVVLHLADDRYRAAVPVAAPDLLLNADAEITQQHTASVLTESVEPAALPATAPTGPTYYVGSGSETSTAVPKELNFVWLGGELKEAARGNLQAWADKAREADWKLSIWTDEDGRKNNKEFLKDFADSATVQHRSVKDLFAKDKNFGGERVPAKALALHEAALKKDSLAMASDVARYALLYKHGGVYLDVDLGPGAVMLRPEGILLPKGDDTLPMFGPMLQNMASARKVLGLDENAPVADRLQEAAAAAYEQGLFGNQFIVAHPESPFMKRVLDALPDIKGKDEYVRGVLKAAMKSKNVAGSTGPGFLSRQLDEHTKSLRSADETTYTFRRPPSQFRIRASDWEDWTRLDWLTAESENLEVPGTTSAPSRQGTLIGRLADTVRHPSRWGSGTFRSRPALLPNEGTLLTGIDASSERPVQGGKPKGELVGKDGRTVSYERVHESLRTIRDASGKTIGYASHSDTDWAPRKDFYAKYRAEETSFATYRKTDGGKFAPVADDESSPRTVPWHSDTSAPPGQKAPKPLFFDAHGSRDGVKLQIRGELPLVVDGAQFARFMETLRDPSQPPAPVVLVACDTASPRAADGGSVLADAVQAVPGRRWYAPDVPVGHASKASATGGNGATGVLALLADPATQRQGQWVTAGGSGDAGDGLIRPDHEVKESVLSPNPTDTPNAQHGADKLLLNTPSEDQPPSDPGVLRLGGGTGEALPIPKRLNFIWMGAAMTPAAQTNLRTWAVKARESGWEMRIWTDENGAANNRRFLDRLAQGESVVNAPIDSLFEKKWHNALTKDPLSKARVLYGEGQKHRSFAMASDAARYAILYEQGGVYLDVDLAPGGVDLPPDGVRMPVDDALPMFGPRLRDESSVRSRIGPAATGEPEQPLTPENIRAAAVDCYATGEFNNALIAAHPRNRFLKYLLKNLVDLGALSPEQRAVKEGEIKRRDVASITGPVFIDTKMNDYNRKWVRENPSQPTTTMRGSRRFSPTDAARDTWIDLTWVTAESANQETASLAGSDDADPAPPPVERTATVREKLKKIAGTLRGNPTGGGGSGGGGSFSGAPGFLTNSPVTLSAGDGLSATHPPLSSPSAESLLARTVANPTPDAVLTGRDGRRVTYGQVHEGLQLIRGADGRTLGFASHTPQDWAPRKEFYATYRSDENLFAHYRTADDGTYVPHTDEASPSGEVPWQTGASTKEAPNPLTPLFFDAHATVNGIELHVVGEKPLEVDGAQFARFMETLRDPAQPPAPVVLVACDTGKPRPTDGGSIASDAAHALPGRLWYAPDVEVGHARPATGAEGATGVLGLLADPVTHHRGRWITAGEALESGPAVAPVPKRADQPAPTYSDMIFEALNTAPQSSTEQGEAQTTSDDQAPGGPQTEQTAPVPPQPDHDAAAEPAPEPSLDISYREDGVAPQLLRADDEESVRKYVFTSLARGDYDAVHLLLDRLGASDVPPGYLENLRVQFDALATDAPPAPPVPREIHFVWLGGDMPTAALTNIFAWVRAARSAGWNTNLWTDGNTKLSRTTLLRIRTTTGLTRMQIDTVIDPRLADSFAVASAGGAYPFASDLARYSILRTHGGVYADVDLGPGTIDLAAAGNTPGLRQNDLPVFGPLIRDVAGLNLTLERKAELEGVAYVPPTGPPTAQQVRAVVDYLLDTGGYGNHFISAQRESAFIERLIVKVADKIRGLEEADEMKLAGPASSGPFPMLQVLNEHLEAEFGVRNLQRGEYGRFQGQGRHFHEAIEWLTAESENQGYER
ncbi:MULTISPECIES: glycosyltransferase [unclassified Streptomyces]|uniref:glycosyltransferase n=1 Tax=Streptomyces sp. NPDC055082 TaxID=3365718 RepID=UPI0037D0AAB3